MRYLDWISREIVRAQNRGETPTKIIINETELKNLKAEENKTGEIATIFGLDVVVKKKSKQLRIE